MKQLLLSFLLFTTVAGFCQERKVLKGKIIAQSQEAANVNVRNLSTKREVSSSGNGSFSILAGPGDTLVFTSVQLKSRSIQVEKEDFDYDPFVVKMEPQVTELKEIVIHENRLNAETLGIVPRGMKTYTPAERRYYTATTGSGFVSVDGIINMINGKTKQIKKEMVVEKQQSVHHRLSAMYPEEYLIQEFKIPAEQVEGFLVFASENKKIATAVRQRNKTLTTFLLADVAQDYLKRIADGK